MAGVNRLAKFFEDSRRCSGCGCKMPAAPAPIDYIRTITPGCVELVKSSRESGLSDEELGGMLAAFIVSLVESIGGHDAI